MTRCFDSQKLFHDDAGRQFFLRLRSSNVLENGRRLKMEKRYLTKRPKRFVRYCIDEGMLGVRRLMAKRVSRTRMYCKELSVN